MTIHEKYHELAEQSLSRNRVDAEAYIVKVLSEMVMNKNEAVLANDRVPESRIDEHIDSMQDMFVIYMKDKSVDNLQNFLKYAKQILSEVYHDCDSLEKRKLCKKTFAEISKI